MSVFIHNVHKLNEAVLPAIQYTATSNDQSHCNTIQNLTKYIEAEVFYDTVEIIPVFKSRTYL